MTAQEANNVPASNSVTFDSVPLRELWGGDRRFEGETYLTGGYRLRRLIESSGIPFAPMQQFARVWQPGRLKGIPVSSNHGQPFFAATQVFDIRPTARKWLAAERTNQLAERYVKQGCVLVTCSGSVGDAILSYAPHEGVIISHDLLRVEVHEQAFLGYMYAFLRSRYGRMMLRSSRYGNIIKHLEPEHLHEVPMPLLEEDVYRMLTSRVKKVFQLRDEAYNLVREAEDLYSTQLGAELLPAPPEQGYSVQSSALFRHQRRLDGFHYNPTATGVLAALKATGKQIEPLSKYVDSVFGVPRFKHIYVDGGIPYLDSEDLFKINPEVSKFIPSATKKDAEKYYVKKGWLLMASSGQLYGLNGSVVLADAWHENKIISNHVLRIIPRDIRAGYLQMVLNHPVYGRPLVLRLAFGTEVPEIPAEDVRDFPVVRLAVDEETAIADRVERASALRMAADEEENAIVTLVENIIESLLPNIIGEEIEGHEPLSDEDTANG